MASQADELSALNELQSLEVQTFLAISSDLSAIGEADAAWNALYDDTPVETAGADELLHMLRTAPTPFAKGMIAGALKMRLDIAAVTGRPI
jgi:ABC-type antimicrobial peptide transport system ATPase subunit